MNATLAGKRAGGCRATLLAAMLAVAGNVAAGWTQIDGSFDGDANWRSFIVRGVSQAEMNRVFLATLPGRGVFKSTGSAWQDIGQSLPTRTVEWIRPYSATEFYLATGTHGAWRTDDAGATWRHITSGASCQRFNDVRRASASLWLASGYCRTGVNLLRSTDGTTWSAATGIPAGVAVYFAYVVTGTTVLAGTAQGVYLSTDNGATFAPANGSGAGSLPATNGFIPVQTATDWAAPATTGTTTTRTLAVAISGAGVFTSTDWGATWTARNDGLPSKALVHLMTWAPSATFPGRRWAAVDGQGIFQYDETSARWSRLSRQPAEFSYIRGFAADPYVPENTVYVRTDAGLFVTTDGGSTWSRFLSPIRAGDIGTITSSPKPGVWFATGRIGHYRSVDGGNSWSRMSAIPGRTADGQVATGATGNVLYASTPGHGVFRSSDGGNTWSAVNNGLEDVLAAGLGNWVATTASSDSIAYFSVEGAGLYRTQDGGASWAKLNIQAQPLTVWSLDYSASHPQGLLIATDQGIFRSSDGGTSWSKVFAPTAADGLPLSFNSIRRDALAAGTWWAAANNLDNDGTPFAASGLYRSTDDGTTWTQVVAGSAINAVRSAGMTAPATLYVNSRLPARSASGLSAGIFASADGGTTWQSLSYPTSADPGALIGDRERRQLWFASSRNGGVYRYAATPADCLFNWAEKTVPNIASPAGAISQSAPPYYFRFYPGTTSYLATSSTDNHVHYLGPTSGGVVDVGPLAGWLTTAGCSGH